MYKIINKPYTLDEATSIFPGFPIAALTLQSETEGAFAVVERTRPGWDFQDYHMGSKSLWLFVPNLSLREMSSLSQSELEVLNYPSADLRDNYSYHTLVGTKFTLWINVWLTAEFPDSSCNMFRVVLVSGQRAVVAEHYLDDEELEGVIGSLQGACGSSGINYNPWRMYDDAVMEEAEGAVTHMPANVVVVPVFSVDANRDR
jgi:hypothetical protein